VLNIEPAVLPKKNPKSPDNKKPFKGNNSTKIYII
jgi:hypothetical protein